MRTSILLSLERIPWIWRMRLTVFGTIATHYAAFLLGQRWIRSRAKNSEVVDPIDEPFEKCVAGATLPFSCLFLVLRFAVNSFQSVESR